MVSKKLLDILHKGIKLYDEKMGKDYLIVFGKGKTDIIKYCQVTFYDYNFWHLLGCKEESKDHFELYESCKKGEDISMDISLVHSYSEAEIKHSVFESVFDFVANAKSIRIGYVEDCPEQFYLTMSMGDANGFVGYDYPKGNNKKFLIPKSVQDKKVSMVTKDLNKILFVLSKQQNDEVYTNIEYEIKQGIIQEYLQYISEDIKIDFSRE